MPETAATAGEEPYFGRGGRLQVRFPGVPCGPAGNPRKDSNDVGSAANWHATARRTASSFAIPGRGLASRRAAESLEAFAPVTERPSWRVGLSGRAPRRKAKCNSAAPMLPTRRQIGKRGVHVPACWKSHRTPAASRRRPDLPLGPQSARRFHAPPGRSSGPVLADRPCPRHRCSVSQSV